MILFEGKAASVCELDEQMAFDFDSMMIFALN